MPHHRNLRKTIDEAIALHDLDQDDTHGQISPPDAAVDAAAQMCREFGRAAYKAAQRYEPNIQRFGYRMTRRELAQLTGLNRLAVRAATSEISPPRVIDLVTLIKLAHAAGKKLRLALE